MEKKKIQIADSQLEYVVVNRTAKNYLLCFPGFGQSAEDFQKLSRAYPNYKIVAVNLFFHGESYLRPKHVLENLQLRQFLTPIIEEEFDNKFSVIGYSMGGRFALATLNLFPENINQIYLLAPDGLVEGNWYKIATRTQWQRKTFKKALASYPKLLSMAMLLSNMGALNKGLLKFAQIHLKDRENRDRVYNTWTCFRNLKLSPGQFHYLLNRYGIKATLVLGQYDSVIPIKRIIPKLIESQYLTILQIPITHNKLFYYNFLDEKRNSSINSNE